MTSKHMPKTLREKKVFGAVQEQQQQVQSGHDKSDNDSNFNEGKDNGDSNSIYFRESYSMGWWNDKAEEAGEGGEEEERPPLFGIRRRRIEFDDLLIMKG